MSDVESAPILFGKYQLLEPIARGGVAEVFKAKSHGVEGFEKVLVIKRILPEVASHPAFVETFIQEAKIAVTLSHANIVQVFDLGFANDSYFIAMELVSGFDFASVLQRGRLYAHPLPIELGVYVVSELAKGLDYAHRRRDSHLNPLSIVHRDVSPQNVLLSFEGEVKLADFGIAKARAALEDASKHAGKRAYMAPEQVRGGPVDARADLYGLGAILFETLAGERLVTHSDHSLRERLAEVPEELAEIVVRATAVDPAERYPNAGRLYEELIQFLYSSGRRAGGHDLARYLVKLKQLTASEGEQGATARIRAVFSADSERAEIVDESYPPAATPRTSRESGGNWTSVRSALERRDVTVMVAHSEASEFLLSPPVTRTIHRNGGLVWSDSRDDGRQERIALFGVRDPDGKDCAVGTRCALRIGRSDHGPRSIRLGLHTGRVLVELTHGEAVRDEALEALIGEARRLAECAGPGQVLASAAMQSAILGQFAFTRLRDTGEAPLLVTGERALADASGKFIGRRRELRSVGEILASGARGKLTVLALVGEAGVGKTRLLHEIRRRLRLGGHDVGMYVATCLPQARGIPLSGALEMLRAVLGIEELDSDERLAEKVERLRELGLGASDLSLIAAALGLQARAESVDSLSRLLRPAFTKMQLKLAEDRLTVFALDGAESLDDESQMLLDAMIREGRDSRIAIVLSYRPGFMHAWRGLENYAEVALGPMDDEDVERLASSRLGVEALPPELSRELASKSAGNPLHVEEHLKALVDSGAVEIESDLVRYRPEVAEVEVPKTLRGIVASRLSRLSLGDRQLLQIAAVSGARWTPELLAAVLGEPTNVVSESLAVLESRGLVVRIGPSELGFAHDLVAEVLRDGLTLEAKRNLHAGVARALEVLYELRLDELAERLAMHWREAGHRSRAVHYLERAAERLGGEHANERAIAMLEQAVALISQMPTPDRERMLRAYERMAKFAFAGRALELGASVVARGIELAEASDQQTWMAKLSMRRGRILVAEQRIEEGRRWLERASMLARTMSDPELTRDIVLAYGEGCIQLGDYNAAIVHFERAFELSRGTDDTDAQLRARIQLAFAYASAGRREVALNALSEARSAIDTSHDRVAESELFRSEAFVYASAGQYAEAVDAAERALEIAKEVGLTYEIALTSHELGEAHLRLNDHRRAFASLRYSYEMARDHGFDALRWANERTLGFIDAMRFGSDDARTAVVNATQKAQEHGFVRDVIQGRYYLAVIDQYRGAADEARTALREVLRLASERGHAHYAKAAEFGLDALDEGRTIPMPP